MRVWTQLMFIDIRFNKNKQKGTSSVFAENYGGCNMNDVNNEKQLIIDWQTCQRCQDMYHYATFQYKKWGKSDFKSVCVYTVPVRN